MNIHLFAATPRRIRTNSRRIHHCALSDARSNARCCARRWGDRRRGFCVRLEHWRRCDQYIDGSRCLFSVGSRSLALLLRWLWIVGQCASPQWYKHEQQSCATVDQLREGVDHVTHQKLGVAVNDFLSPIGKVNDQRLQGLVGERA